MESDLYVFAGPPAGVPGEDAGDHAVGPSPGQGRGERVLGRGKGIKPLGPPIVKSYDNLSVSGISTLCQTDWAPVENASIFAFI